MKGNIPIQAGKFRVDATSWFDVRRCDGGWTLSLLDEELNLVYTVIVDKKKVVFKEVANMRASKADDD